jgi:SAM-dependent methyltransferase
VRASELAKMYELEDGYWWFVARRELVRDWVARYGPSRADLRILDVGCGTGATLSVLEELGQAIGIDSSAEALGFCRKRKHRRLILARAEDLPTATNSVDVITALDLLEHIEDDAKAARQLAEALRPGGLLLVTVPAYRWLWSGHDEALDHVRRYEAARLREVLLEAGLEIERFTYVITGLLLPIAVLRLLQRIAPKEKRHPQTAFIIPPKFVNRLLIALLRLESRWLKRYNLPVGVSLVAAARKVRPH